MIRDLAAAITTDLHNSIRVGLTLAARVGDWLLSKQLDDVVCDWANKTHQGQP